MARILPVILSGGSGTRLWPASRSMYPKQLLALAEERTMLQATALRTAGSGATPPTIAWSSATRRIDSRSPSSWPRSRWTCRIILEPEGRNTAPAVALAALRAARAG